MPSEALSVRFLDIHSASSGIHEGTGCNFIFFSDKIQLNRPIYPLYKERLVELNHTIV